MFSNIGRKIKKLASLVAWLGIIGSIISGAITFYELYNGYYTEDFAWIGIIVAIVGAVASWIGSFLLYGFGELIEQTSEINKKISIPENKIITKNTDIAKTRAEWEESLSTLKRWKEEGIITEAEYIKRIDYLMK